MSNPTPQLLPQILDVGPDQDIALISGGSSISYGDLRGAARNVSAALATAGVRPGERVLVVMPNDETFVVAVFAIWRAGGVAVPLDYRSPAGQILTIARDCRAAAILCDGQVWARIEPWLGAAPSLRLAVVKAGPAGAARRAMHVVAYEDAISVDGPAPEFADDPHRCAVLAYTSGSTGRPKGVMHSHESLILSLVFTGDHLGLVGDDRVLVSFPLYHLFSFRVLLAYLMVGATVILSPDILAGLESIQRTRPNAWILVPAACALVVNNFARVVAGAPPVRRVCIGSAGISPRLLDALQRLLPDARIHLPYGMTEARIGFLEPVAGRPQRRLAAVDPNLTLRVLDENGNEVHEGIGEVVLNGAALMIGYWHNSEAQNARIRRQGVRTRDLMEVAPDGRYLVGRLDDVINVGGEKVFPNEVEAALLAHPAVHDAKVVGVADPHGVRGQVVKATIEVTGGAPLDEDEIRAHCRARLEPYKIPAIVETVARIARNEMGKVVRAAPRQPLMSEGPP